MTRNRFETTLFALAPMALMFALGAGPAGAVDSYQFDTPGADEALRKVLMSASLSDSEAKSSTDPQEVFAAARADYARILGALYAEGYYSGTINILVNGREAAGIAALDIPEQISSLAITVTPGPQSVFSRAAIAPLAPKTELPEGFATGKIARSDVIREAASTGVDAWREAGHAKADIASQKIIADHRSNTLDTTITLAPGPELRFGTLTLEGYQRLRPARLEQIAGFPTGEVYSPEKLDTVRKRLRKTEIFSSITLTEADKPNADGTLDMTLAVVEQPRRRYSFGAELDSLDGLNLNGYWLHRNLRGRAEKLKIYGEVNGIGGSTGGIDYKLGARVDRPATLDPDTSGYVFAEGIRLDEKDYTGTGYEIGFGLTHDFSDKLSAEIGLDYKFIRADFGFASFDYKVLALPISATFDDRDDKLDAHNGYYLEGKVTPYYGIGLAESGAQVKGDARAYRGFSDDRFVIAARGQLGAVRGSTIDTTPSDYLFYSGGGGTVRGQPYQSLGVNVLNGGTQGSGGTSFAAMSLELRAMVTKSIGVVGFYDAGFVSDDGFFGDDGNSHAGAGIGVRYKTAIGPIRLDVATPVSGNTGDGVQFYLGIGQAF
jgi:translocation and assembly module TamA